MNPNPPGNGHPYLALEGVLAPDCAAGFVLVVQAQRVVAHLHREVVVKVQEAHLRAPHGAISAWLWGLLEDIIQMHHSSDTHAVQQICIVYICLTWQTFLALATSWQMTVFLYLHGFSGRITSACG